MIWILLLIAAFATACWLIKQPHKYWIKRGVKQGHPVLVFGDNWGITFRTQSNADMSNMWYKTSETDRYCGIYQFLTPSLVLRDPDLIKQITVKDFDHFLDHRNILPEGTDEFFSKNLFSLTGQKWKDMRSTLSPAFTSSKMKNMFSLISQSGEQFAQHFLKQNKDTITVEMKDTFTRFTNDVIANTAFGIECDSLGQPENEFYMMGKKVTDFSGKQTLKFIGFLLVPQLCKLLNIKFFGKDVVTFFNKLVSDNIQSREKHGIVRPDMINLLMEARKLGSIKADESDNLPDTGFATVQESEIGKTQKHKKMQQITDADITAQALIFFFGGFDSVSSLMCFMSYELGVNPDIQAKLREEIDETLEKCNGKLTYEAIMEMKYMDMVTSETLRKWPNAPAVDRVCTKPYTIEPKTPYEKPLHLKEKDIVILPIYGLHRDPKYFPDPERFDPERFNDENKANIKPYSYLPFGSGPRNCIGSRFALLETKVLFFYILANFEIVPVEKTQIPLKLSTKSFNMIAEHGFWLGLKRRVK